MDTDSYIAARARRWVDGWEEFVRMARVKEKVKITTPLPKYEAKPKPTLVGHRTPRVDATRDEKLAELAAWDDAHPAGLPAPDLGAVNAKRYARIETNSKRGARATSKSELRRIRRYRAIEYGDTPRSDTEVWEVEHETS